VSYLSEVLADNPAHLWRCAEGGGWRLADIGATRRSLIVNANFGQQPLPYTGPNPDSGSVASGARITGPIPAFGVGSWTIELLFWSVTQTSALQTVLEVGDVVNTRVGLLHSSNGTGGANWYYGLGPTNVPSSIVLTPEVWHHLVLVNDTVNLTSYVNAVQDGQIAAPATSNLGQQAWLNSDHAVVAPAGVWAAEYALYASALSPTRVTAHFLQLPVMSSPVYRGLTNSDQSGVLAEIRAAVYKTFSNS